jgi:hypothetical protein
LNATTNETRPVAGTPVGPYVREQIVTGLTAALADARADLGTRLERVRGTVEQVLQRLVAIDLVHAAGAEDEDAVGGGANVAGANVAGADDGEQPVVGDDGAAQSGLPEDGTGEAAPAATMAAQPESRLCYVALATARGEPVGEFLLIPFGEVVVERPIAGGNFVFTRAHAEAARRWFERMGRKLAIDYEHQSFGRFNARSDGLRPAAGWIGGLDVRDDGLWAVDVTWTERADGLLRTGEYRYFSPVIFWTDDDHTELAALGPVALTNDPAMRGVQALAAGRRRAETEESADAVPAGTPGDAAVTQGDTCRALLAAQREIHALQGQLVDQQADAFIARGLEAGKILESTSADWRADYLRDPTATEARLTRTPALLPPGRVVTPLVGGAHTGVGAYGAACGATQEACGDAPTPEDLAAYEQAAAAGRVLLR